MGTIIIKNSQVSGKVPLSTDLQVGELAVDTASGQLYTKHSDNVVKKITNSELASSAANYAPSKTGAGASGTWGINITGNAATATNLLADASVTRLNAYGSGNSFGENGVELFGNGVANTIKPSLGFHQPNLFAGMLQQENAELFRFYKQNGQLAKLEVAAGTSANQAVNKVQMDAAILASEPTTTRVLNATAGAGAGAVGTYALLVNLVEIGETLPGNIKAASSLYYASTYDETPGAAFITSPRPSGTWLCMGFSIYSAGESPLKAGTLWLRIA